MAKGATSLSQVIVYISHVILVLDYIQFGFKSSSKT